MGDTINQNIINIIIKISKLKLCTYYLRPKLLSIIHFNFYFDFKNHNLFMKS